MKELPVILKEISSLATELGYPKNPGFNDAEPKHDFGRLIGYGPQDFWHQYMAFVRGIDGFSIDGYSVYGLKNYSDEHNELFEYNDELTTISQKAPSAYVDSYDNLIVIGHNGTDTFVYDIQSKKWDMRDRIAIDEAYESHDSFESFLSSVVNTIIENNS
ncbi:YrhA family protein [Serratia rubidaea]|uniref:YrhA family protein n=1 Tax=Serratia rubidaea TaxID=61652 RepID=UPI000772DEF0|nr:YrhA family protein [Serratia rubidaea]